MTCNMPTCQRKAVTTWGLCPVCEECRKELKKETKIYYQGKMLDRERTLHNKLKTVVIEKYTEQTGTGVIKWVRTKK